MCSKQLVHASFGLWAIVRSTFTLGFFSCCNFLTFLTRFVQLQQLFSMYLIDEKCRVSMIIAHQHDLKSQCVEHLPFETTLPRENDFFPNIDYNSDCCPTDLGRLIYNFYTVNHTYCVNYRIFMSLIFYVKSKLENLKAIKLPFLQFQGL